MENKTSGIGIRDKVGYMMGDVGSLLVFGLVQSVLQKYYTDILGLSIVSVMIMFVIARVWDAINDPMWGRIIDNAKPRENGRYKHWLKIFAIPVALSAVLMFVKIPGLSQKGYFVWATITYILFGMLYTCINIPYGSMLQVITSDDKERSSLSVFRSVGCTFGAIPAMVLISLCYDKMPDGSKVMSYSKILTGAIIIACFSVLAFFLCHNWSSERVPAPVKEKREKAKTFKVIKALFSSRPYVAICLASMLFLAAQMFSQSYYTYLFHYYFNAPGLSIMPTACQYLPVAVIMLFVSKLGIKFGRREICAYGILAGGVFYLLLFVMNTKNVWLFLAACMVSGIGSAFIFLLVWSLATDAMDYNAVNLGIHDEATSYSLYSFMRKLGQTVAAILVNSALMSIGYTDNVLNTGNITEEVLKKMYSDSVLIPAVLYLLIFVLLRFVYPLGKKEIEELQNKKSQLGKL